MKVLIITGKLQEYRVAVFNRIVEKGIDLTVAHSAKKLDDGTFLFKEVILKEKKIGSLTLHKENLKKYCCQFDIVIPTFYLQKISFMRLLFGRRSYKIAYWGIGVKVSADGVYDQPTILNKIRYWVARKSDAMIFYTDYAKKKYISNGIDEKKLFVMNNSVNVDKDLVDINHIKSSILFIGTVNKRKKIFELLNAYAEANNKLILPYKLEIIGGGEELENVKKWVTSRNLDDKIIVHGAIYNKRKKAEILNRSFCAISPSQAGLSVLEVMGHGVPFITHKNAITGGERFNIKENNGILFKDFSELEDILIDVSQNSQKYINMGKNAFHYYYNSRTCDHMVGGFFETINFLNKL